ncbi:ferrous iron transport protein A [Betaproteobacteria bacterium PRO7]|jgi:ferrous iron transport protein A|nr:ferrous iron transport protein A [Betaproteobacteria bacterium PRO7]
MPEPATTTRVTLDQLARGQAARVRAVVPRGPVDSIGRRLGELGFVPGEAVRLVAHGPFGREPVVVQVGFTRFALRRAEAQRVHVEALAEDVR